MSRVQNFSFFPNWTTLLRRWRHLCRNFVLLFVVGLGLSLSLAACSPVESDNSSAAQANQARVIRIGYQKSSTLLNLLKNQGTLEKQLEPENVSVTWAEFAAGPQMLEALNVGSIDFAYTGETPPIFAQAAGAPLRYVAYDPVSPKAEAILVQQNSPIQSIADLKGKTVALNKGSNVHYLLVRALESAGLEYGDIQTAYLPPGDARLAFEQGSVDAWVIWDPFMAAAETATGARILADGEGLVANRGFFLSTQTFVEQNPDLLQELLQELEQLSGWTKQNLDEVAGFLAAELGIDKPSLVLSEGRRDYDVRPLTPEVIAGQQEIADTFFRLGLIPQEVNVADVIWTAN